jgi:uncharacterized integral membrane protein
MSRARTIGIAVLVLLAVVVVLQNTAQVETRFLFFSLSAPRAVMLTGTLLIGFALGVLATWRHGRVKNKP